MTFPLYFIFHIRNGFKSYSQTCDRYPCYFYILRFHCSFLIVYHFAFNLYSWMKSTFRQHVQMIGLETPLIVKMR